MPTASNPELEVVVIPRSVDLADGFQVHRALPSAQRRMVGPFVFLDGMGPGRLAPGRGVDVRPHPHIGLATVTYLFEGELLHRDSLGTVQTIQPGELNWMTAGRGIAHSERTPPELRRSGSALFGVQAWVALPKSHEETEPSFVHHETAALPVIDGEGKHVRLIVGTFEGARSPVHTFTQTVYADITLAPGAVLRVPTEHEERGVYIVDGTITLGFGDEVFGANQLVVFKPGAQIFVRAESTSVRFVLLGGEAMDGPRHVWWNFVSSSRERIEQAKADWISGRFGQVPGETEFIPLPDR
jgi:redox-sensitive bicupin YhaK (pirin superfamily)